METRREERINKLTQALKRTDKIHLRDAATLLGVSEMTIRRDLSTETSALVLLGGYVVFNPKNSSVAHYFVSDQKSKHIEEKQHIGRLSAALITENDTVFFDCGTTTPFIIDAIADELFFTAICHSLKTFLALQDKPHCQVILCGGEFKPSNAIFTRIGRYHELDHIRPNIAFISAAGLSLSYGVTCFNFNEIDMKHQAIEVSQQKVLVADSSKFDQVKPACIGALTLFDQVITDQLPDREFQRYFATQQIALHY